MVGATDVTSATTALVQDETILAYLQTKGEIATAGQIASDLAAKYAQLGTVTVDGQTMDYGKAADRYATLARKLTGDAENEPQPGDSLSGSIGYSGPMVAGDDNLSWAPPGYYLYPSTLFCPS